MKVAILLPTWLGDTCMSTPTIRAIRQGMPEIDELCVAGRYAPVAVLEGGPWVDSTLVYKPNSKSSKTLSRRGLVAELKNRRFDMIVLLPNSLSAGIIGYLSGAKRRVGFAKDGRALLLTDPIPMRDQTVDHRKEPAIDYYLNIAKHLGCDASDRRMQLFVSEHERDIARDLYSKFQFDWDRETILFNTSSAAAASKLWPVGHASRAAKELATKHGVQVVVHCGPADRERANAIAFGADHPLVKSMGREEEIPVSLSKAIIEQASVVVSTDSGPRHMAVAMNKKVISLFGSTAPEITRTYNRPETILRVPMACQPCRKETCPLVHTNCMHALNYSMVVNAVLDQLGISSARLGLPVLRSAALARGAA
ncbi:MAG: lipopolysaccharide heptosyltransferase II [Planctomycetota bacterium]|nr:lipopolysaccharide heptosyltransferase II [Planctomycetota bacterium]